MQSTLIQSQWARRYTSRAVSVIAMFDPDYTNDPAEADCAECRLKFAPCIIANGRVRNLFVQRTTRVTAIRRHTPEHPDSNTFDTARSRRMCRNIKILYNFDPPVTAEEVRAASLQFVRKISGFNKPSKANERPFLAAVDEIAAITAPPSSFARDQRAAEESGRGGR